jgi:methylglyoxal synthase
LVAVGQEIETSSRLAHFAGNFGVPAELGTEMTGTRSRSGRPSLALTAEGQRRADLILWATAHADVLATMRLLAPAGVAALLAEHTGLTAEPLKSGSIGPAATAGLATVGDIDAMIAFSDPIELRPGDMTTRSLTRLAVFWDIPVAGNRATGDLLLASLQTRCPTPAIERAPVETADTSRRHNEPARGAVRLWTIRATVDDVPGRLAVLAASLARCAVNILSVQVHLTPDGPVDELLVAASPILSAADLAAATMDGGARTPHVTVADAHALVDAPTRAATLATRLVRTPNELPAVLTSLLPGAEATWHAEPPADQKLDPTQLWLTDPSGGGFLLSRPAAPFTPAECARAYAMVDVTTAAIARPVAAPVEEWPMLLADGTTVTMRRATPEDLGEVADLHDRCSLTSRLRRYLAGIRRPADSTLARLLSPQAGHCLLIENESGRIVAMGNLIWDGEAYELALLVEDEWQQRRLGTVLARKLVAFAVEDGAHNVKTVVHAGNMPMIRIISALAYRLHREYDGGLLTLIATVRSSQAQTHRLPSSILLNQSS